MRRRTGALIKLGTTAGLGGILVVTAGQMPAAPAYADVADCRRIDLGLERFVVSDGLERYAGEVQRLLDVMSQAGVRHNASALNLYEVPTVEGVVRYITDRVGDFRVYENPHGLVRDPEHGDMTPDGGSPDCTVDPYDTYQEVYTVVPTANASLPVNPDTLAASPTQAVDATTWNYTPTVNDAADRLGLLADEDQSAKWKRNNDHCYAANTDAWLRQVCWHIWNQEYDSNSSYSYWQFHMEASSEPRQGRHLEKLWVEGVPMSGNDGSHAAQAWDGHLPEPNSAFGGNSSTCSTSTKNLQMGTGEPALAAWGWELQYTNCEQWAPKMYDDQGHWATIWTYNDDVRSQDMRHTAFNMGVKTLTSDKLPGWLLYSGTQVSSKPAW